MDKHQNPPILTYGAIPMSDPSSSLMAPATPHLGLVLPLTTTETSPESPLSWRMTNIPVLATCFSAALATGGPTYAFGLYGATLKATLHLTQSDLETLSSANFCAGLLSWIPGLAVDRLGPRNAMTLGGSTMAISLLGYWLVARQIIEVSSAAIVPTLSALGICIFMSNSLVVGSLFKSIVLSCGLGTKGAAVGAAKGYLGLGAGVYSALFDALRKPEETELDFLILAAFFAVVAIALPAFTLLPRNGVEASDVSLPTHYRVAYTGLGMLALSVVGSSAVFMFLPIQQGEDGIDEDNASSSLRAAMLLIAWFGPIGALFFLPVAKSASTLDAIDTMAVYSPSKPRPVRLKQHRSTRESKLNSAALAGMTNLTLTEMLQTPSAYLMLWACTIVVGSGTMLTNNMGQMTEARGLPNRAAGACLALFSVAQAGARVATGALSESALSWQRVVPRPYFLVMSCLVGLIGHVWLALSTTRSMFVVGVILVGFSFGMVWPLLVLVVGDIFGTTNHGANYMFYDGFTSAIGTVVISKYIAQGVYESHITDEEETTCFGTECFQRTHWIVATLCLTAMISSLILSQSTKGLYVR